VTGDASRAPDLDPAVAASVARFFAADDAPGPPPGLADRIWEELLQHTVPVARTPPRPALRPDRNGRRTLASLPAPPPRLGPSRLRGALTQLATAALVLVTLVAGFVAFGGPQRLMNQVERPSIIPAIDGSLEAATLVEALVTTWPEAGLPFWASIRRITLEPGAVEEQPAGVGPQLFTVESGPLTVDAAGSVVVTRGTADRRADPTTVPAATTIVLDEGDQFFAPSGVSVRRRNDGSAPAVILEFRIADLEPMHHAAGVRYQRLMPDKVVNVAPPAPAAVALYRLRLLPGSSLSIRDLPGLQMLYVEEGTIDLLGALGPGELIPASRASRAAGQGIANFETTPTLANRSADPVTVLVATIGPAEITAAASDTVARQDGTD
jgi:hypothetical protein